MRSDGPKSQNSWAAGRAVSNLPSPPFPTLPLREVNDWNVRVAWRHDSEHRLPKLVVLWRPVLNTTEHRVGSIIYRRRCISPCNLSLWLFGPWRHKSHSKFLSELVFPRAGEVTSLLRHKSLFVQVRKSSAAPCKFVSATNSGQWSCMPLPVCLVSFRVKILCWNFVCVTIWREVWQHTD